MNVAGGAPHRAAGHLPLKETAVSLVLRRKADGSVRVTGDLPAEHAFAPGFIERGIADGYVSVQVVVKTAAGDAVYRLRDFTDDDGNRNVTAWRCDLAGQDQGKE